MTNKRGPAMYHPRLDAQEVVKSSHTCRQIYDKIRWLGVHRSPALHDSRRYGTHTRSPQSGSVAGLPDAATGWAVGAAASLTHSHADTNKCTVYGDNDTPL